MYQFVHFLFVLILTEASTPVFLPKHGQVSQSLLTHLLARAWHMGQISL